MIHFLHHAVQGNESARRVALFMALNGLLPLRVGTHAQRPLYPALRISGLFLQAIRGAEPDAWAFDLGLVC